MKKILLLILVVITSDISYSQNVFSFFEYDIKDGMRDQFINGYTRDLEWHKSQADEWSWIGWFVLNGNRRDRFIDATPDHSWSDFDNWKVNASENARLNKIHWALYVENSSGSYRTMLTEFSSYGKQWYKSKYQQVYFFEINPGESEMFELFLEKSKSLLQNKLNNISFVWMKTVSGGNENEYCLFIALDKIEYLSLCTNLFNFSSSKNELQEYFKNSVIHIYSELWSYNKSLSLFSK